MAGKRTCFVISPIGADETDVRSRANDFLELLAEPALQKFNFDVIRADKIQQPTAITGDIIRLVQEADLCLIDLTDSNPNVFYECGRRHETGKPFIQLVAKGAEGHLPFDVAGIRTIPYDLSSSRSTLNSVQDLQGYIQAIVEAGFNLGNPGESLSSMAQSIERIERKVNLLTQSSGSQRNVAGGGTIEDFMLPPMTVFHKALSSGDLDKAFSAVQRLSSAKDKSDYVVGLTVLASAGIEKAFVALETLVAETLKLPLSPEVHHILMMGIGGVKKYYESRDSIDDALSYLMQVKDQIESSSEDSQFMQAFMYNQLGMIFAEKGEEEKCIESTAMASQLNPSEPAYVYNLALAYGRTKNEPKLNATLTRLKAFEGELDEDHLRLLARHGM